MLKNLIKYLLSFLQTVYIFESKKNKKPIKYKNIYLKKFKSINEIENKNLKNYLIKEEKNKRFRKNCYLLVLFFKKDLVSMGWMNEGITWHIDEKNKKIDIKDKILLFDFYTLEKFRNKGYSLQSSISWAFWLYIDINKYIRSKKNNVLSKV